MTVQLDTLLENLHSDENRLRFLRSIYTPGNTKVADRILVLSEDSSVIEREVTHAKKAGDTDRFRDMGREYIDYCVTHGFDIQLRNIVIRWQDPELADYAIAQMTSKSETDRKLEDSFKYSAEIARAFGKEDVARANLERLLALQERDSKYKFPAAQTLKKLGRFDEAIDRYLACGGYGELGNAMDLAREHSSNRVSKVAQRGFDSFDVKNGFAEFYVGCAEVLGKTKDAEKVLVKYAKKVKVERSPRFYNDVVKALVSLGQEKVARKLVERVAQHGEQVKASEKYHKFDRSEEMAQLYHTIGETDAVRNIYTKRIETRIREGHHPSNTINDINKAIELTGDRITFMKKRLLLHEKQEEYEQASKLATELGKPELAENYMLMHQMVQSVQAQPSK